MGRTRRELLSDAGVLAAGAALAGCFPDTGGDWPSVSAVCADDEAAEPVAGSSRVVEIERASSVLQVTDEDGAKRLVVQAEAMRPMLDVALAALVGTETPWRTILPDYSPSMRIGIKVNCLNEQLPTSVPLVKALVDSLKEKLDVEASRIIVWDRRLDELQPAPPRARFVAEELGATVMGTVRSIDDPSGPGYSSAICGTVAGRATRLSRIMTELTDVTINCPVLKTHTISGITGAMKNIYGVIDNPGDYHTNLVTALPALYRLPPIRRHIRLTVLDALIAVTVGGTSSPPDTAPRRILASLDPLALDAHALALVNQLRGEKNIALAPVEPKLVRWLEEGRRIGIGSLAVDPMRLVQT